MSGEVDGRRVEFEAVQTDSEPVGAGADAGDAT